MDTLTVSYAWTGDTVHPEPPCRDFGKRFPVSPSFTTHSQTLYLCVTVVRTRFEGTGRLTDRSSKTLDSLCGPTEGKDQCTKTWETGNNPGNRTRPSTRLSCSLQLVGSSLTMVRSSGVCVYEWGLCKTTTEGPDLRSVPRRIPWRDQRRARTFLSRLLSNANDSYPRPRESRTASVE